MQILLQISENILLLSFMGLGFFFIERYRETIGSTRADVLIGLCFGVTAALVTVTPVTLGDGATVDARAGPVVLAGIVAGPIGALLAAAMGGIARGIVGGNFVSAGVVVYAVYGLTGVALRQLGVVTPLSLPRIRSIIIVAALSLAGASAMFFLISPPTRAFGWLQKDLPYILFANTLSVVYAAVIVSAALVFLRKSAEVVAVNEALRLAKRAGRFGIWDYDISSGKLLWDERSRELHGVQSSEFEGTFDDWSRNVHPEDLDETIEAFEQALSNERVFDTEYRVLLPDGSQKWIKGDAIVMRDNAGNAVRVVGSNIDLTKIRATEAKLAEARSVAIHAQKVETIGQLTGGVAHDFNNLLAVVMGNLELLRMELQAGSLSREQADQYIDDSLEAARRGAELTQNLLAYARKAQLTPVAVDLNEVVRQTEDWISRTIESRIEIELALEPRLWQTMADRSSLQSALVNLLVNARDAIDGPGRVSVATSNVQIDADAEVHGIEALPPGRYVMLAVSDTGSGMAKETAEKIFDPFFTTKPIGQGTGLGLSMVHGFVKQSRGTIRVDSEPGRGTRFTLYFPAISEAAAEEKATAETVQHGGEGETPRARILLVEDQDHVRSVLEKILTGGGFDVVTAASGDEALASFGDDDDFALMVTDIAMPGELQGPSLAQAIRRRRPDMRVLFLSGYAGEAAALGGSLREGDISLGKPVSRSELLGAVAACLRATHRQSA